MPVPAKAAPVSYLRDRRASDVPPAPPVTTSWEEFDELMGGDGRYLPDNVVQLRSTRKDIASVYAEEVRHGTHCRILTP